MCLSFQLPLSGSPTYLGPEDYEIVKALSTPSLGITAREAFIDWLLKSVLSTPSLGITEPDSGIFRLSAAFCRGTPSHK